MNGTDWIGYRLFFFTPSFFFHSCLSDSRFYEGEKKRGMLSMHGFGSVSVFCFLFFNYTTGGCLASLPFVIFCSFLFDPPIPLPLLSPPFPYLWCPRRTLTMCFFSPIVSRFPACCSGLRSWGRMSDVRQCYDDKHLGLLFLVDEVGTHHVVSLVSWRWVFFPPLAVIYNCSLIAPACGGMCGSVMKQWPHILHGASLA